MFERGKRSKMGQSRASKYRCSAALKKIQAVEAESSSDDSFSSEDDFRIGQSEPASAWMRGKEEDESEQDSEAESDEEFESGSDYETGDESGYYENPVESDLNRTGTKDIGLYREYTLVFFGSLAIGLNWPKMF